MEVVPVQANWKCDDIQPSNKPLRWNLIELWTHVVPAEQAWSAYSGNNRNYPLGYVRANKFLLNSGNSSVPTESRYYFNEGRYCPA